MSFNLPSVSEVVPFHKNEISTYRLCTVLKTKGCSYARHSGGCLHCSLLQNAVNDVSDESLLSQFDFSIAQNTDFDYSHIDLLVLGSFLDDEEVSTYVRKSLLKKVSLLPVESVTIESRPEYITLDKIEECISLLNGVKLEIALGIESTNDYIRDEILRKNNTMDEIEKVIALLAKCGVQMLGYVLIKPPGICEREGIKDGISSSIDIFNLGKKYGIETRVALQPMYIPKDSYAYQQYIDNQYMPPRVWSIIEILKHISHKGSVNVALNDEGLANGRTLSNCGICTPSMIELLKKFNYSNDIHVFDDYYCNCKEI